MSFELNEKGSRVLYLNFRTLGDGEKETESEQLFSFSHLIEDSSQYLVSIERFRIPIQGIPMQDAINNAIILRSKSAAPDVFINTITSFSLYDWMLQITNANVDFNINLTADGRVQIVNFDFGAFSIELSQEVSDIFDMPLMIDGAGVQNVIGSTPVFDRFDQLFKINIEALNGLSNLQQEVIDTNVFTTILTDFIVPSHHSLSVTNTIGAPLVANINYTYPVREDLEFNASQARRMINFRGSSPIQNVKVRVTAIYRDGSRHAIVIPRNGVFELKCAFWRRSDK